MTEFGYMVNEIRMLRDTVEFQHSEIQHLKKVICVLYARLDGKHLPEIVGQKENENEQHGTSPV